MDSDVGFKATPESTSLYYFLFIVFTSIKPKIYAEFGLAAIHTLLKFQQIYLMLVYSSQEPLPGSYREGIEDYTQLILYTCICHYYQHY